MSDLIDGVFYSSLIQKKVRYRVLVPNVGAESGEPLPVLYLLHGMFGSFENWTDLTQLNSYVNGTNLLVVMPDGGDNWYTDSVEKYEGYLIHDLMPAIEKRYHASSESAKRAIAGNSMGGYGALKLALRHPEMFSFAASFSGAFNVTRMPGGSESGDLAPSILRVFGEQSSSKRIENDIYAVAERSAGNPKGLPHLYFDCGLDDKVFLSANREFAATLSRAGVPHEYLEKKGGHDWQYWDSRVRHLIATLYKRFSLSAI